jgi:F-type H+-transporting ATPase subunit b
MKPTRARHALRWALCFSLIACLGVWLGTTSDAQAQNPPQRAPRPGAGLPAGHPPIDQRPRTGRQVPRRPPRRPRTGRPLKIPGFGGLNIRPPKKPVFRYARDAHGYCVGDGPNDLPKPINFVHGLLMVNKDKALAARPRARRNETPPDAGFFGRLKGQFEANWPIYKWQWTPSLYRYENHDDSCDPRNEPTPLAASVFNVGLVFFLLFRFGRPKVREALVKRKHGIMSEIDRAADIKRQAKKRLAEYTHQLDHLGDKRDELRAQYKIEGEHEEAQLREDLSEAHDRMMADAHFLVGQESKSARDQLSKEALANALDAAEALLLSSIDDKDHMRLAEEYLEQIGDALKDDGGKA